jgi:hypothetical protein
VLRQEPGTDDMRFIIFIPKDWIANWQY